MLKKTILATFLLFCGLACSYETEQQHITYTNLFGDKFVFDSGIKVLRQNDSFSKVTKCKLTENCIKFDETMIILPPMEVFSEAKLDRVSIYQVEEFQSIELEVEYESQLILGETIEGFIVTTYKIGKDGIAESLGVYFYSKLKGIVSFEYNYGVISEATNKYEIKSIPLMVSGSTGLFPENKIKDVRVH